jgi:putative acetyltransferase
LRRTLVQHSLEQHFTTTFGKRSIMQIRKAIPGDINELKDLYYGTITTINSKDYYEEQIKAWAATADRKESLLKKILEQYFFVAENDDKKITGFISLSNTGYLDLLYVHKDFQRQGIAKQLLQKIIETAGSLNISELKTDASITAKPFFEKHQFKSIQQQTVRIKDVELINYKMERTI